MKLESTLVGVAGEYLVAGELTRRGHIASISLRNSRGIDIIASNSDASRSVTIQVKTNRDGRRGWIMNKKAESFHSPNHFYIFVSLRGILERSNFFIVNSQEVADYVLSSHQEWLAGTKKDGSARKDSSMRMYWAQDDSSLEAWDRLGL